MSTHRFFRIKSINKSYIKTRYIKWSITERHHVKKFHILLCLTTYECIIVNITHDTFFVQSYFYNLSRCIRSKSSISLDVFCCVSNRNFLLVTGQSIYTNIFRKTLVYYTFQRFHFSSTHTGSLTFFQQHQCLWLTLSFLHFTHSISTLNIPWYLVDF